MINKNLALADARTFENVAPAQTNLTSALLGTGRNRLLNPTASPIAKKNYPTDSPKRPHGTPPGAAAFPNS